MTLTTIPQSSCFGALEVFADLVAPQFVDRREVVVVIRVLFEKFDLLPLQGQRLAKVGAVIAASRAVR